VSVDDVLLLPVPVLHLRLTILDWIINWYVVI